MTSPTPRDDEDTFDPDEVPEVLDEEELDDDPLGEDPLDELDAEFDEFDDETEGSDEFDADDDDEADAEGTAEGVTAVTKLASETDTSSTEVASGFVDPDGEGFTDADPSVETDPEDDGPAEPMPFDDEPELVAVASAEEEVEGLREGEFVCRGCYIARRETQLADEERQLCRDCA